jgi:hypothetical protein
MALLPRAIALACLALLGAAAITLAQPSPPPAQASIACDAAGAAPITGGTGIGNLVGDACEAVSKPVLGAAKHVLDPLKDAAASIGQGVFNQIVGWASDGAVWLLGEVVSLTEKTTTPDLTNKGFLRSYREMASIAVVLAMAALLLAIFESLGQGDGAMLFRVFFIHIPLAAIATSAAYVVVQLLIVATDGLCAIVTHSARADTHAFFEGAIKSLAQLGAKGGTTLGTPAGMTGPDNPAGAVDGAVAVPLFVGFIAAIVAAIAAFMVWIELLMRDAAIYAVAAFMPFAIAASIRPRWLGALRRAAELIFVTVSSKFVIVAIVALAASLLASGEGQVQAVLAAGALLLLAAFSPLVIFRWVGFAEGAVGAALGRQSAAGASLRSVQTAYSTQAMRRAAHANWSARGGTLSLLDSTEGKGGKAAGSGGRGARSGRSAGSGKAPGTGAAGASSGAAAAVGPAAAAVGATVAVKGGVKRSAGAASAAAEQLPPPAGAGGSAGGRGTSRPGDGASPPGGAPQGTTPAPAPAQPQQASGGETPRAEAKPPRPGTEAARPEGPQGGR